MQRRQTYFGVVVQTAPNEVLDGLDLLRQLEDTYTVVHFLPFTDSEGVCVAPDSIYTLKCSVHALQVRKSPWEATSELGRNFSPHDSSAPLNSSAPLAANSCARRPLGSRVNARTA